MFLTLFSNKVYNIFIIGDTILSSLWKLLKSMKFAIWLLIILAVASLVSMFIVEFYPIDTNFEGWEQMYAERYGAAFPVMKFLHLQDPYRSFWYQLILGILTLSLTICVIDRLPANLKLAFGKKSEFNENQIKQYSVNASFTVKKDKFAGLKEYLHGYSVEKTEKDNVVLISASRSRISYLGPVFTHLGLLFLVIGGFLAIWGVSTHGAGFPGDIITPDDFDFQVRVDDFRIEYYPLGVGQWVLVDDRQFGKIVKKLPGDKFKIEFSAHGHTVSEEIEATRIRNQFNIEADRGNIKDYISDLTILENGREVTRRHIEVNQPMRYKGYRFYQSSFDPSRPRISASIDSAMIHIASAKNSGYDVTMAVILGNKYPLPDGTEFIVSDFMPHFMIGDHGPMSASGMMRNPAVKLSIYKDGVELSHQWLFLLHDFHGAQDNAVFNFKLADCLNPKAEMKLMTIIEIKKNQGYEVIWIGLILATIGVFLSFYFVPKHIRIAAVPEGDNMRMTIGGYSPREKVHFEEEFNQIIQKIKNK